MYRFTNGESFDIEDAEDVFSPFSVAAQEYDSEVDKDLYIVNGILLTDELEMIKFRYYTPDGTLLEQENVPVVRNGKSAYELAVDNGYPGTVDDYVKRGARYLGIYASDIDAFDDNTDDLFVDDYYLNSTDGYVYRCDSVSKVSAEWIQVDASSEPELYSSVMNDAIANLASDSSTMPIVRAMNVWIQTLTAKTAFIESLFAKNITMQQGGIIKSQYYNGKVDENGNITAYGNTGWAIDYNGKADFSNMEANGGRFNQISVNGGSVDNELVLSTHGVIKSSDYDFSQSKGFCLGYIDNQSKSEVRISTLRAFLIGGFPNSKRIEISPQIVADNSILTSGHYAYFNAIAIGNQSYIFSSHSYNANITPMPLTREAIITHVFDKLNNSLEPTVCCRGKILIQSMGIDPMFITYYSYNDILRVFYIELTSSTTKLNYIDLTNQRMKGTLIIM